jgi:NhaA family Na+:H+ antiporter
MSILRHLCRAFGDFLSAEAAGGAVLIAAMVVAMTIANTPLGPPAQEALAAPLGPLSVGHWINDGLMAVFFLVVATEIRHEMTDGELSRPGQAALPVVAALGGMAVPALVYLAVVWGHPGLARGWAIPSATDIAFSLGVLALAGPRVPPSLRAFLAALAIIDDLGAIVVIVAAYAKAPSLPLLGLAVAAPAGVWLLGRSGLGRSLPFAVLGVVGWLAMLNSGVHATLAGVLLGLALPRATARRWEAALNPWVAFVVVPLFALANSGVRLTGLEGDFAARPVALAVALGLFAGKVAGVGLSSWLMIRFGPARLPAGASLGQFLGTCLLTGIGFTMSLFIATLAFGETEAMTDARLGVLAGSLVSALCGWAVLSVIRR